MRIQASNKVLIYINTSTVLSVALLSYIYNYEISDVFVKFGLDVGNWVNYSYGFYCIFHLFIPFTINYISIVLFHRAILNKMLKSFAFLHIIWFVLFIMCII